MVDKSEIGRYLGVFVTFARNSLVRDMTFRANFIIESVSSLSWMLMNLGFYVLIFGSPPAIGHGTGWGKYQFFVFLATTMFINSVVQAFFMPNAEEFSELIRTGGLDFALLKPIDTQFLISLQKVDWSTLSNFLLPAGLLAYSLLQLDYTPTLVQVVLYPVYLLCGVAMLYSLMIALAATSVWLGRNQTLYDFWFYITNFSRYPDGDLRRPVRHAAAVGLHVHRAGAGRGQRAGPVVGAPLVGPVVAAGGVRTRGRGGFAGRIAVAISPGDGKLPQRE